MTQEQVERKDRKNPCIPQQRESDCSWSQQPTAFSPSLDSPLRINAAKFLPLIEPGEKMTVMSCQSCAIPSCRRKKERGKKKKKEKMPHDPDGKKDHLPLSRLTLPPFSPPRTYPLSI